MLTEENKKEIAALVMAEAKRIGSQEKFGATVDLSGATISNIIKGKWANTSDKLWNKLAAAVNYHGRQWQVAETRNYKAVTSLCDVAQREAITVAVSHDAGAGKSCAAKDFANKHRNAFYVQCHQYWTQKMFLASILRALGRDPDELTSNVIAEEIISTLRGMNKPVLILDEVDKLRDPLLMFIITLYNELDGVCGMVFIGAPYLRISWEKAAKRDRRGFRELMSRVGRRFVHLEKIVRKDVELVCQANGIDDANDIQHIWNEVEADPDLRRVKRSIEKKRMNIAA